MTQPKHTPAPAADDATLITWLADHQEVCPLCAYDLRGLTSATCPECRTLLALTVGAPHLRFGAWIFAVISCALGLGFDAVVCTVMGVNLVRFLVRGFTAPPLYIQIFLTILSLALVTGLTLAVVLRCKKRWLALSPPRQRVMAGTTFLAIGVVHALTGFWLIAS